MSSSGQRYESQVIARVRQIPLERWSLLKAERKSYGRDSLHEWEEDREAYTATSPKGVVVEIYRQHETHTSWDGRMLNSYTHTSDFYGIKVDGEDLSWLSREETDSLSELLASVRAYVMPLVRQQEARKAEEAKRAEQQRREEEERRRRRLLDKL